MGGGGGGGGVGHEGRTGTSVRMTGHQSPSRQASLMVLNYLNTASSALLVEVHEIRLALSRRD